MHGAGHWGCCLIDFEENVPKILPGETLQPSHTQLRTYSGEPIPVVGQLEVDVGYEGQVAKLPLLVVEGEGPSLFGRDWLSTIRLDWKSINAVGSRSLVWVP